MSRTGKTIKKLSEPDVIYGNRTVTRLINRIMQRGKKTVAQNLVYKALDNIKTKNEDPIKVLELAVLNVGPKIEVRPRRVGGASYQVPMEVRGDRRVSLALRWIVMFANKRSNKEFKTYDQKLTAEIIDAANNTGEAVKKRDTVIRMAEANRAFAHFKW
jgi:small subunit ribosomal protein S7